MKPRRIDRGAVRFKQEMHMNAIALFLMLVLNGNMTCGAEPPDQTMLGDQAVQVQVFDCYWSERESASHQFVVISPICPDVYRSTHPSQRGARP
jgi:hypothetical protein